MFYKKVLFNNIYFDSDLVWRKESTINSGKIFGLCAGNILPLKLINSIRHTKSEQDLYLYNRNLKNDSEIEQCKNKYH